jgi:SAM-dependent methyltransferase
MRESDYPDLVPEGGVLMSMQNVTNLWHQSLYRNSLWEYAMAYRAVRDWFGNRTSLRVADYGYSLGLPPLLYWLGYDITLVQVWRRSPEEENYLLEHLRRVKERRTVCAGCIKIWPREVPMDGAFELMEEEKKFDAVFCTSVIHRLGEVQAVFRDVCQMVRHEGLLFLTTSEEDREPKIRQFGQEAYKKFYWTASEWGFLPLGGHTDYDWDNQENTFASLVMVRA